MGQAKCNSYTRIRLTAQLNGWVKGQIAGVPFTAKLKSRQSATGGNSGRVVFIQMEKVGEGSLVTELLRALEALP